MDQNLENVDPVTGYLQIVDSQLMAAKQKTLFLKDLQRNGDESAAADKAGVTHAVVKLHIKNDPLFNKAYKDTLLSMKHEIEGKMFRSGKIATGHKLWLERYFPEEYVSKRFLEKKKPKQETAVDRLMREL